MKVIKQPKYIIILLVGLISGCSVDKNERRNYIFENIQLTRHLFNVEKENKAEKAKKEVNGNKEKKGEKSLQINALHVNYDRESNIVRGKEPRIIVYSKNKPKYDIIGKSFTVLNKLNVILIEGDVKVIRFQKQSQIPHVYNRMITGDYLKWDITKSTIIVKDFPEDYYLDDLLEPISYICTLDSGGCQPFDITKSY